MPEAMSFVEIEDVLSSIRRLVSEDLRPASRQAAAALVDDKLILTPALRVVAEEVADPGPKDPRETIVAVVPVEPRSPLPRLHLGVEPVIEELVASLEQAVAAQGLDWESETGDPAPQTVAFEWTSGVWSEHRAEPVAAEIIAEAVEATPSWAQEDPGEPVSEDPGQFEAMAGPAAAEADPVWADEAEAEVVAGLVESESRAEDAGPPDDDDTEMTYDEDVLRDLVRDLIREELQGGLGERITRNVRKLVRAEIARALASHEFD